MHTTFIRLITIMDELRENCPWDKKQTINTLRQLTIEETYELADAIDNNDWAGIKEELGDMLLHIVFYAKIATEKGEFTLNEVINEICEKLIRRHPHIYEQGKMDANLKQVVSDADVKENWEKLKLKEGKKSILSGVPKALPSMVKAIRLQEKSKAVGFEWNNIDEVLAKVNEEMQELKNATSIGTQIDIEDEMGDVLFSLINFARFLQVDADAALERTNSKFIRRFTAIEQKAAVNGNTLSDLTLAQMDELWNEVKALEKNNE